MLIIIIILLYIYFNNVYMNIIIKKRIYNEI